VPFVPPWDADFMRAYATTIPMIALFLGFGIQKSVELVEGLKETWKQKTIDPGNLVENETWRSPLIIFSTVIILLCFPLPIILQRVNAAQNINLEKTNWITEEPDGHVRIQASDLSNFLNIVPDSAPYSMVPNIRRQDFLENTIPLLREAYPEFAKALETNLTENVSLRFDSFKNRFVIIDTQLLKKDSGVFRVEDGSVKYFQIIIIRSKNQLDQK
jgi:hypothetical protein